MKIEIMFLVTYQEDERLFSNYPTKSQIIDFLEPTGVRLHKKEKIECGFEPLLNGKAGNVCFPLFCLDEETEKYNIEIGYLRIKKFTVYNEN